MFVLDKSTQEPVAQVRACNFNRTHVVYLPCVSGSIAVLTFLSSGCCEPSRSGEGVSVAPALRWGQEWVGGRERRREGRKEGREGIKEGGTEGREEGRKEGREEGLEDSCSSTLLTAIYCTFLFTGAPALLRDWLFSWRESRGQGGGVRV